MHFLKKPLTISRLVGAAAALWLCVAGSAWAGGSADSGSVQSLLDSVCGSVGLNVGQSPFCPQLPTVSQGVLEIAALLNLRPEATRVDVAVPGTSVYAGNTTAQSPLSLSGLTPLAFVGALTGTGQATPTQVYDPKANSFFYAVATFGTVGGVSQPQTLNLIYDYLLRTTPTFVAGHVVAKLSLPLVVLKPDGSELVVCGAQGCPASTATLTITATCASGPACLKGEVSGDFNGAGAQQSYNAADLGVTFSAAFGKSLLSPVPHATFAVQLPLVVTNLNDPPYFNGFLNPLTGSPAFANDQVGYVAPVLGAGMSVGVPPYAGPPCANSSGTACPAPPAPAPLSSYGFCASFANNFTGPIGKPAPAAAAFVQLGLDGEVLASAPLPSAGSSLPQCPF
jgi:hypothetical protein